MAECSEQVRYEVEHKYIRVALQNAGYGGGWGESVG